MKKLIAVMTALVLSLALVCTASAETIRAKAPDVDMNCLEGRMVRTDLEYMGNNIMSMTLYVPERFDAAAIKAVKAGDVIVTDGEEVAIVSVDQDGPDLVFNKGTDNEMLFCDAGHDEFEHAMENDTAPWIKIGSMEQSILEYYPILDQVDPVTGEVQDEFVIYRGDKLQELLQNPEAVGFSSKNVDVVYDRNNQPVLMMRYYSPAQ